MRTNPELIPFSPRIIRAINFCMTRDSAMICARPGKGKTRLALYIMSKTDFNRALIISPKTPAATTWRQQNEEWGFNFDMRFLHGKDRVIGDEKVTLINPGGLPWFWHASKKTLDTYDFLIIDELQDFKNADTSRFMNIRHKIKKFYYHLGLTGTPIGNRLESLWSQAFCIDGGECLGKTKLEFLEEHFTYDYGLKKWNPKEGALEKVMAKIRPIALAVDYEKDELPEITHTYIDTPMPAEVRELYTRLKKKKIIKEWDMPVDNAAVRSTKLKQMASGNIYLRPLPKVDEKGELVLNRNGDPILVPQPLHLHSEKIKFLKKLITKLKKDPLLVFYEYSHDRDAIIDNLDGHCDFEVVSSSTSVEDMIDIFDRWNKGEIPVLIAQAKKIGVGGNLQHACANMCFYSVPWSLEVVEQCFGRIHRTGQQRDVDCYWLVCPDSKDEDILLSLKGNKGTQDEFFKQMA